MSSRNYLRLFKDVMAKLSIDQLAAVASFLDLPELSVVHAPNEDGSPNLGDFVTDYFEHFTAQVPDSMASHRKLAQALTITNPQIFAKLLDAMLVELSAPIIKDVAVPQVPIATAPVTISAPTTPIVPRAVASHGGELNKMIII